VFVPAPTIHLPPKQRPLLWLNANHRPHWTVKSKVTKAWREAASSACQGLTGQVGRVHVVAYFHKPRGGRYDAANLYPVAKACVDGAVDSGLLAEDDNDHVVGPDPRAGEPRPDAPGVRLVFTPS